MNFNRYPTHWSHLRQPTIIKYRFYDDRRLAAAQDAINKTEIIKNYLELVLPGLVSERIASQLPIFLRDNSQMQQILNTHLDTVKKQVADAAKEKIDDIVNEPQYHIINTAFFDSVRQKADNQFQTVAKEWRPRLEEFDNRRQEIDAMQKQIKLNRQVGILHIISGVGIVMIGIWICSR